VYNKFIYENRFVVKVDTHIKFIEKNQRKKIICKVSHIKNIIKKYLTIS
jgi:hypothetical protein